MVRNPAMDTIKQNKCNKKKKQFSYSIRSSCATATKFRKQTANKPDHTNDGYRFVTYNPKVRVYNNYTNLRQVYNWSSFHFYLGLSPQIIITSYDTFQQFSRVLKLCRVIQRKINGPQNLRLKYYIFQVKFLLAQNTVE